jgi:nucleoside-diphosphate-sugar epimerase
LRETTQTSIIESGEEVEIKARIVDFNDPILVTGAAGFIGTRVVGCLLERGYRNIRCLDMAAGNLGRLEETIRRSGGSGQATITVANLLSKKDCTLLAKDVVLIYHLAAAMGMKSFSDAYLNSVVTTRNLLDSALEHGRLRRFVNMGSFAVYSNRNKPKSRMLDESCPIEEHPESRAEAYVFSKVKQEELVKEYGKNKNLPYVILRPGNVFGPGKMFIPGRVGIDPFGIYLDFGGSNPLPLTYVDNCAEAIVTAGLVPGIEGEAFNIVDDDIPSCRRYLRLYKKNVRYFRSLFVPHAISYLFCYGWEVFSNWSNGQIPPVYTRREWVATWKRTRYSNQKLKEVLGWTPTIPMDEGLKRYFEAAKGQ